MNAAPPRPERWLRLAVLALVCWPGLSLAEFRVTPYLQNPSSGAITVIWFSEEMQPGRLFVHTESGPEFEPVVSVPVRADELAYHPDEKSERDLPYRHRVRLEGLRPGQRYRFRVAQGNAKAGGSFETLPDQPGALRFMVFGDSETEPESTGQHVNWPAPGGSDNDRRYLVDQEAGYRENLGVIRAREPDFVAIAGDLVESGGEQRDWDAFWRLTGPMAAGTVLFPALGNHDYFGGPGGFGGYGTPDSDRASAKYFTYFDLPANGSEKDQGRYYRIRWGPVTLIVLDLNNGLPHRSDADTNFFLLGPGEGGHAPDWQPGSPQYRWLEGALALAREESAFTFVVFHHCPFSSGVHGLPPGTGPGQDPLSGRPLQRLAPLFLRYGVDALFTGHDEMYEHSVVAGTEIRPDGTGSGHSLHVYDIGIGGDGLRAPVPGLENPYRVFLAHDDSPELHDERGALTDGGKHYGHLEVNVEPVPNGGWEARLDPVYVFPVTGPGGEVLKFERRIYPDSVLLRSARQPGDQQE